MKRSQEAGVRPHGASPVGHVLAWWWALLLGIAIGAVSGWLSVQVAFFVLTLQLHV